MDKGGSMHRINCHLLLEKLLDSGLSSCAAQRFEFLLTLTVASVTKTWSPKKQVKLVLKLDSVYALIGFLTLYKRWETKSWPFKGLLSPKQSFPWSWSVIQRHGLTKKKKEKRKKLFQALDCLYVLIRILTLHKRWKTKCWAFKGSVSPKKYLP